MTEKFCPNLQINYSRCARLYSIYSGQFNCKLTDRDQTAGQPHQTRGIHDIDRHCCLVEPLNGHGYRSRDGEQFALNAKGAAREEVLTKLRDQLEARLRSGSEVASLDVPRIRP